MNEKLLQLKKLTKKQLQEEYKNIYCVDPVQSKSKQQLINVIYSYISDIERASAICKNC